MNRVVFLGILFGGLAPPTFADTVVFNTPANTNLGTTATFTLGTTSFTASEFNDTDLFAKDGGGDEIGLGLTGDPAHDNEIYAGRAFIQLDVNPLLAAGYTNFSFMMNSVTSPEVFSVSVCSTAGVDCGTSPITGTTEGSFSLTGLSLTNRYVDFSATTGNMLIHSLSATAPAAVPEPASIALLGTVLFGVLVNRRKKFSF